jgi:LysR family glycine cleavage system transcriptional activator
LEDLRGVFEKRGTRDRTVKVTAAPTFGKRWLPPRIPRFLALYPDLTIEIEASVDLRPIEGREFNVGVRSGYGQWPGLIAHELVPVYRAPMLSPSLAKSLGGISRAEDLLRAPLLWEAAWQDWFKAAGINDWSTARRLRMSFETQDVLADVAQTGVGVALLSPFIFREEITAKRLICPIGPTLPGPENFYVVYDPSRRDTARDLFIGWLRATVAAEMALPPLNGIPVAPTKARRRMRRR